MLRLNRGDAARRGDSGVGHEDVDPPVAVEHLPHHRLDARGVGDVADHREAFATRLGHHARGFVDRAGHARIGLTLGAGGDGDDGALLAVLEGAVRAQPAARARDDGDLP